MTVIGFTGTRRGTTGPQQETLRRILTGALIAGGEMHHGDCVGADEEAHAIADSLGAAIYVHPPVDPSFRAYCDGRTTAYVAEPKPYLERNRDIVDESDVLVACPDGPERRRSGTWATIRYARNPDPHEGSVVVLGVPVIVIWRNGAYSLYRGEER